jgi:L-alanine-DL-glutamate epimerase-like enolase superfamily enzyme
VGRNSQLEAHGVETLDDVLHITTDLGIDGIGSGSASPERARSLLGRTLAEFWRPGVGVVSPLGSADHALFDVIGKALNQPAWQLLGGQGTEWVPVYDGGIYFDDLLPDGPTHGIGRILTEVEDSLRAGHRAFKIKVGRGYRWLPRDVGLRRDVAVVKAVRRLVGKDARLMVDANNGYSPDTVGRFLDEVDDDLFFVEEMFPENVHDDLVLGERLRAMGQSTLVADGESAPDVGHFDRYIRSHALDVLQPDIRRFGITRQWELARRMSERPAMRLAPHNWGSFLGLYMSLILGRGIGNFLMAEEDRSNSDLFDTSAFTFKEGRMQVPNVPGCGLVMREDVFRKKYLPSAWTVR